MTQYAMHVEGERIQFKLGYIVEEIIGRGRETQQAENRVKYNSIRNDMVCKNCMAQYSEGLSMHFHHIDPRSKVAPIINLVLGGFPWDLVEFEMTKCMPLCRPCHMSWHKNMFKSLDFCEELLKSRQFFSKKEPKVKEKVKIQYLPYLEPEDTSDFYRRLADGFNRRCSVER